MNYVTDNMEMAGVGSFVSANSHYHYTLNERNAWSTSDFLRSSILKGKPDIRDGIYRVDQRIRNNYDLGWHLGLLNDRMLTPRDTYLIHLEGTPKDEWFADAYLRLVMDPDGLAADGTIKDAAQRTKLIMTVPADYELRLLDVAGRRFTIALPSRWHGKDFDWLLTKGREQRSREKVFLEFFHNCLYRSALYYDHLRIWAEMDAIFDCLVLRGGKWIKPLEAGILGESW